MSKSSRRRKARKNKGVAQLNADPPSSPQPQLTSSGSTTPNAAPSFWSRAIGRRKTWLLLAAGLIGLGGILIAKLQVKPGVIEYNSDDPDAQVIMEKDGQDFPLKKGTKYEVAMDPGHYNIRLAGNTVGLKLSATFCNLDPGGKGIVKVIKVGK
jgi:hypothetical protein